MLSLLKKEIYGFLSSLIGYIVISVFLLLMGLFIWVFDTPFNLPNAGFADLDSLFRLAPVVFLFLIPAITMRSFAEEKRTGTIELLLTRPLSDMQIIFAKYIAGLLLVVFSLLPTLLYYFSVNRLGNPPGNIDTGGMWGSYIGLLLLASGFVAIGIFSSILSSNQIVAFIIGVFLCFFFYLGFDFMGSYSMFGNFDGIVKNIGIIEHYHSLSRGVIDTRDVLYFLSLIALFLLLTKLMLQSRKKVQKIPFVASFLILIFLNIICNYKFARFDLTSEKRHTLAASTIKFLNEKLIDIAYFKIYLAGNLPADLKRIEREVREKLEEMKAYAGDKIQYSFYNTDELETDQERNQLFSDLVKKKLNYSLLQYEEKGTLQEKVIFPGAIITYGDKTQAVQFFNTGYLFKDQNLQFLADATINNIEYILMDGLRKAERPTKPSIAFIQGHDEADMHQLGIAYKSLMEYYNVNYVEINNKIHALDEYKGAIIVQPKKAFSEKDKFVIDQFIMNGGRVAWFIDPLEVWEDTLYYKGQTFALARELNLDDQLFNYGVRVNKNLVIDKISAPIAIPGYPGNAHEWYFYPVIMPDNKHPITRNLNPIKLSYASTVEPVGDDNAIRKTPLLSTSDKSLFYNAPVRINYGIIEMKDNLWMNSKGPQIVGMLLEGEFKSVFTNRLAPEFVNSPDYTFKEKSRPTKMLVIGDGNLIMNKVEKENKNGQENIKYLKLNVDPLIKNPDGSAKSVYGNREFLMNVIDYIMGDDELIDIRQRTISVRRLNYEKLTAEKSKWQFINVGLPVILLIGFGLIQNYLRKRKYTK